MQTTDADVLLSSEECAEFLKIHPRTVARLAKEKKIPGTLIAGNWRFLKSQLVQHLREVSAIGKGVGK